MTAGGSRLLRRVLLLSLYALLIQLCFYYKQNQHTDDQEKEYLMNIPFRNHQSRRTFSESPNGFIGSAKLHIDKNTVPEVSAKKVFPRRKGETKDVPIAPKTGATTTIITKTKIPDTDIIDTPQTQFGTLPDKQHIATAQRSIENTEEKEKLQLILDRNYIETGSVFRIPSKFNSSSTTGDKPQSAFLWNHSELIPRWMKKYFNWHRQQRQFVTESNWHEHRWLVMSCLEGLDESCGGAADRLKPFLYMIRSAYEMNRILIIYWSTPMELENFLLPPVGGIDWRAPPWFKAIIRDRAFHRGILKYSFAELDEAKRMQRRILRTICQSSTGGEERYEEKRIARISKMANNTNTKERSFKDIYHDVWRIFFTPTEPIAEIITNEMNRMELVPGEYAAAHLRALYAKKKKRAKRQTVDWTQNSLNCASALRPGGPIFFASELTYATQVALDYNNNVHAKYGSKTRIVSRIHGEKAPLHFEKMEMGGVEKKTDPSELKPSDLYETFVDLYLLGMSSCLTYNRGGFGQWGLLIGYNAYCGHNQKSSRNQIRKRCNWTEPFGTTRGTISLPGMQDKKDRDSNTTETAPFFLEPMKHYEDVKDITSSRNDTISSPTMVQKSLENPS